MWPWKRFDAFYAAFVKRKASEELGFKKNIQVAALFANTNLDGEEGHQSRIKIIESFEENFREAVAYIYDDKRESKKEDDANPFLSAGKKAMQWLDDVVPTEEKPSMEDRFGEDLAKE